MTKEYKLIVAGGRDFNDPVLLDKELRRVIEELPGDLVVSIVSGMAKGADRLAYEWAKRNKCRVYERYADWRSEPRRGGFIRNSAMADESQGLLAFWDGKSRGTEHMITVARNKNLYVRVINYKSDASVIADEIKQRFLSR